MIKNVDLWAVLYLFFTIYLLLNGETDFLLINGFLLGLYATLKHNELL